MKDSLNLGEEQRLKQKGFEIIVGIDEAGRGPLAGPVVACAVCIKKNSFTLPIRDSKKLSPLQRENAFFEILDKAYIGVGIISETVIDQINILEATYVAMTNAVNQLIRRLPVKEKNEGFFSNKVCLLIDGNHFKSDIPFFYKTIVGGDNLVFSIACASIVAKVIRDRILSAYDKIFPQYGFKNHKGYPTLEHRLMLQRFGLSPIHRRSFQFRGGLLNDTST